MSAIKAEFEKALDGLRAVGDKLKEIGHDGWARVEEILHELEGDAPKLEAEAEADAADVVHTAETQGIAPAVAEAEHDGVQLAEDAAHDVAAAVEGAPKPSESETLAATPAQAAAAIAGEAAAAASEQPGA